MRPEVTRGACVQTASMRRLTAPSSSVASSASRWTETSLCDISPSRCAWATAEAAAHCNVDAESASCSACPNDAHAEQDGAELQAAIISRVPAKIDIGPVYNVDPKRRTAYTSGPSPCSIKPSVQP